MKEIFASFPFRDLKEGVLQKQKNKTSSDYDHRPFQEFAAHIHEQKSSSPHPVDHKAQKPSRPLQQSSPEAKSKPADAAQQPVKTPQKPARPAPPQKKDIPKQQHISQKLSVQKNLRAQQRSLITHLDKIHELLSTRLKSPQASQDFRETLLILDRLFTQAGIQGFAQELEALLSERRNLKGSALLQQSQVLQALKDSLESFSAALKKNIGVVVQGVFSKERFLERFTESLRKAVRAHSVKGEVLAQRPATEEYMQNMLRVSQNQAPDFTGDFARHVLNLDTARAHLSQNSQDLFPGLANPKQVFEQFLQRVSFMHNTKLSQMRVQLEPQFLGHAHISLNMENGILSGAILVENEAVKAFLEGALSVLRANLGEKGVNITDLNVELGFQGEESHAQFKNSVPHTQTRPQENLEQSAQPHILAPQDYIFPQTLSEGINLII